jgi:mRNA-degrading endonuclease RelE of RelBE toxin-antitoxin system
MTYIVRWTASAVAELHRLEQAAPDRDSFRQASVWIDYGLRRIPGDLGESRGGRDRLWYGDLLGVYYQVDADAMTVLVMAVAPARRRRG